MDKNINLLHLIQIPQNHLMIIADGVSVQASIAADVFFQFPDFFLQGVDLPVDGFLKHIGQDNGSDPVTKQHIKTEDLSAGDRVSVSWKPNRRCVFRYLGDYQFIVEQAENSKLKTGNTFRCGLFILGEPLYLNDLVQGNNPPVAFVVGNKDGLCEIALNP